MKFLWICKDVQNHRNFRGKLPNESFRFCVDGVSGDYREHESPLCTHQSALERCQVTDREGVVRTYATTVVHLLASVSWQICSAGDAVTVLTRMGLWENEGVVSDRRSRQR